MYKAQYLRSMERDRMYTFSVNKNSTRHSITTLLSSEKVAFTLAEVLISMAIIGVIAVTVLPALIAYNQEKGWNTSATMFEARLGETLKIMNTQQELAGHKTTESFVNTLAKHIKINKICKNDNLLSCFEDKVYWGTNEDEVDIENIKTSTNFGLKDWGTNIIGLQFASGTNALIAYNPKCSANPFNANSITVAGDISGSGKSGSVRIGTDCLAILYDTSGFAEPNTSGKDLRNLNVDSLGSTCAVTVNGTCYSAPFVPTPMTYSECAGENAIADYRLVKAGKEAAALGIKQCYYANDYWAGAVKKCGGVDNMPTEAQLAELAEYLYGQSVSSSHTNGLHRDEEKASALGVNYSTYDNNFHIWSNAEYDSYTVKLRYFGSTQSGVQAYTRNYGYSYHQALCINK